MTLLLVVFLLAAAERRDTMIVTGVYEPVPLEESDRSVSAVDVEKQVLLSNSVVDLLQLDPSLDLQRRAPSGVQTDLSIRGGTFGQSLILLDGLRLNDPQTGHHSLNLPLPLEAVSRIETLKGSGSTLYGSDAVGGAVNLVTRTPEKPELRLRAAAGNFGVNQQRFSLSGARGILAQRLSASRDFSSGFAPNRDYRDLSVSSATYLTTGLGSTSMFLGRGDRPFGADKFYGNFHSWEHTRSWFASVRQPLGASTGAYFGYRRHTDLFVLERDHPESFTNRHATGSLQAGLRRRQELGQNTRLYYGVEGLHDSIASTNLGHHTRASGAVYAALDFRALGRFSFSAGVREQLHSARGSVLSPSLAAGVWVNSRLKLRGSASHAFRLPVFTELYYHDPASEGSPNLRPERAWSYDSGVEWNPGRRLEGAVTVFHRRLSDGIDFVRKSPADIWRAANIQRLRYTGVETRMGARLSASQRVELAYSAMNISRDSHGTLLSRYVLNYPAHAGTFSWMGSFRGKIIGRVRAGATKRAGKDPYAVVDLYLARTGRRLRPFVHLTNLTSAAYEEISGVAMPGRGIMGGVEWVLWGPSN